MTARQIFEASLIELNKVKAPSLLLEDYNYFINKAINQYINKIYNAYEVNQQKSDDLRVLKGTAVLTPALQTSYPNVTGDAPKVSDSKLFGNTYEVNLPDDYLHILNCVAEFEVIKQFKCYNAGSSVHFGVSRLTSDMFSQIINNYYMRPSYKQPYYFVNNVNVSNVYPTSDNQIDVEILNPETKLEGERYGNKSKVRMEIRYGKDSAVFKLSRLYVDYLKSPQFIRLTQDQVDMVDDESQIIEFPDYVIQEIINELVKLLMENASDQRLQTNIPINQSIANPQQEQQPRK